MALVVTKLRSRSISRISIRELVFFGRVSGTVCASDVGTSFAGLDMRYELPLALATGSSDSLAGLLVDEILTTRLGRFLEDNLLVR
jgi:hypothetical protein